MCTAMKLVRALEKGLRIRLDYESEKNTHAGTQEKTIEYKKLRRQSDERYNLLLFILKPGRKSLS